MTPHAATAARAPWLLEQPYAHRGLWGGKLPENGMSAFAAAASAGLGIELDVQLSADEQVVVLHDATLERMTKTRGNLAEKTARELSAMKLAGFDDTIPMLSDVLTAFPETPFLVEMKVPPGREGPLEKHTASLLKQHKGPAAAMSFNPRTLTLFGEQAPDIPRGQLFSAWPGASTSAMQWLKKTVAGGTPDVDFLASGLDALSAHGSPAARTLNVPLLAWTIKNAAQLRAAREHAQQVIFENLPPALAARRVEPYI